ncbi:hypothetical protein SPI_00982 [Niveomyces insectorum RCEF 264]|uniref:Life-span regulatory factor n=1 Tax=Niveomyces insectorum RCEF 264 TaxID=1081102 RepID=A0A168AIB0_9HYPO|nr:hypothetical protein SPI_00982 [Niveomyces insectorum RCEF 264]
MASDLQWDHHFCLTCDKQTDGAAYCSESCRLADYEETAASALSSDPSSPSWAPSSTAAYPWTAGAAPSSHGRHLFSLSPAYDFSHAQPYGSTPTYYHGGGSGSSSGSQPFFHHHHHHHHHPHHLYSSSGSRRSAAAATSLLYSSASTSTLALPPTTAATATTAATFQHVLSPSSSHSSLSSLQSSNSSGGALGALSAFASGGSNSSSGTGTTQAGYGSSTGGDLANRARNELRKYASSLEQGRLQRNLQRRRSC